LREGDAKPSRRSSSRRDAAPLLPELVPIYERLVEIAGGRDRQARLLALWCPTPFFSTCSQLVWPVARPRLLVRNYDYAPALCDAVFLHTRWDRRAVVAASDCLLGRRSTESTTMARGVARIRRPRDGRRWFAIPLVLRYVLERCSRCFRGGRGARARADQHGVQRHRARRRG
jgi:predicted choloylglycine hydrolase